MGHAPAAADLLNVWERGCSQSPLDRALSLLTLGHSEKKPEDFAELKIGERDGRLLELRGKVFGSRIVGQADCPACGQSIEMSFTVSEVQTVPLPEVPKTWAAKFGKYEINFRLPNSNDLATLVPGEEIATQKRRLVQRCVLSAKSGSQPVAADELPEHTLRALSERMSQLDPQGDVQLALTCPRCSRRWDAPFDIASFLWREVHAWAVRLLRDVHVLASAYGWRESGHPRDDSIATAGVSRIDRTNERLPRQSDRAYGFSGRCASPVAIALRTSPSDSRTKERT